MSADDPDDPSDPGESEEPGAGAEEPEPEREPEPARAEADATADEDADEAATPSDSSVVATLRRFVREQQVHLAVILAFAVYPLLYGALMNTPIATELDVFLPRVRTMIAVLYVGLFAMSFDFVSGYTGYLSFGHALFYGIGAYFVVLAATERVPLLGPETPFVVLLLVGALLSVLVALLVGAVSFRLSGVYFAMITLGFAEVGHVFVRNWDHVSSNPRDGAAVGGSEAFSIGIPGVATVDVGRLVGDSFENLAGLGIDLSTADVSYYAIGAVVVLSYFAMQRIVHSPFGRVMIAIRENEERAEAVGFHTFWYEMGAFAISGFFAAVAGALFAAYRRSVAPENSFDLFVTADALLAAIIGGFGTLAGALYGTLFERFLQGILSTERHGLARYLRETLPEGVLGAGVGDVTVLAAINVLIDGRVDLYIGIVFVLFVLYVPRGILGTLRDRLGGTVARRLPERVDRYVTNLRE